MTLAATSGSGATVAGWNAMSGARDRRARSERSNTCPAPCNEDGRATERRLGQRRAATIAFCMQHRGIAASPYGFGIRKVALIMALPLAA
ncbi:hypothetical protein TBR22_A14470 [Luteitalea sp. TBR-22]|nr:hypothetical protein TBR22_A14470 [Luteitalea sp. TBR-22]